MPVTDLVYQALTDCSDFRPSCGRFAESAIMGRSMPSPIGHALAGAALVAWRADLVPDPRVSIGAGVGLVDARAGRPRRWPAPARRAPDLDLLFQAPPHGHPQPRLRRRRHHSRQRRDRAGHALVERRVAARRALRRGVGARTCCSTGSAPTRAARAASRRSGRSAIGGSSRAGTSSGGPSAGNPSSRPR